MQYGTILIDPPWTFKAYSYKGNGRSAENHYSTLTIEDMMRLNIGSLMAKDCAVFMWVTWPTIPQALALGDAWELHYSTCAFLWAKTNRGVAGRWADPADNTNWFMGMGYWTRSNTEPCLLFTQGSPKRKARNVRQLMIEAVRKHSQKPDGIYGRVEALVDGPYLEIFARQRHVGWDAIGNEIDGQDIRSIIPPLGERISR